MNVWQWRSALIIWIFAFGWLQAFDSCAPTRERWSVENREEEVAAAERKVIADELAAKEAAAHAELCAAIPLPSACEPEPGFLCSIFTCEEDEGEASSP